MLPKALFPGLIIPRAPSTSSDGIWTLLAPTPVPPNLRFGTTGGQTGNQKTTMLGWKLRSQVLPSLGLLSRPISSPGDRFTEGHALAPELSWAQQPT